MAPAHDALILYMGQYSNDLSTLISGECSEKLELIIVMDLSESTQGVVLLKAGLVELLDMYEGFSLCFISMANNFYCHLGSTITL